MFYGIKFLIMAGIEKNIYAIRLKKSIYLDFVNFYFRIFWDCRLRQGTGKNIFTRIYPF